MLPANSASGMNLPIAFSWSPSTGATQYDFYLWKSGTNRPAQPTASGLEDISFLYRAVAGPWSRLPMASFGKNPYCATDGPVQSFTLIDLPDLSVRKVQIPASAFSGQPIDLTWEVHNTEKAVREVQPGLMPSTCRPILSSPAKLIRFWPVCPV